MLRCRLGLESLVGDFGRRPVVVVHKGRHLAFAACFKAEWKRSRQDERVNWLFGFEMSKIESLWSCVTLEYFDGNSLEGDLDTDGGVAR